MSTPSLSPFRPAPRGQRIVRSVAIAVSVGVHVVLALLLARNPTLVRKAATWVEVQVRAAPPPPPLEPPPPPRDPPPKRERKPAPPKSVAFEETVAPEEAPPPQDVTAPEVSPQPQLRRVQGLSASSFAPGAGTGLSVRAGNSTAVRAEGAGLDLDAANGPFLTRPASAVAVQPRVKWEPTGLEVPDAARDARVEGTVEVTLDVDAEGRVARIAVVRDLGYGTGAACADAWRRSVWKPGEHNGQPVAVTGIRKHCTIRIQ